ncbi:putative RNA uridine N3 methyltransferase [Haloferax volcanii]|uniref:putative RNA uridine N3 methyltransferase n=1 Tax=Haloferax volcanii TaxID=2246 RepID=UPI003854379B
MKLSVLVPSSLVREAEDKREATRKLGYVARAAAVFRANELVVFPDEDGENNWGGEFVETVLRYAATPPYLRKEVWGKRDELRYAGILPPVLVASTTADDSDESPALREGIVTEVGPDDRVRVNCGMQHPISLFVPPGMDLTEGERVAVRISSREPVRARIVDEPLPGFDVSRMDLTEALGRPDAGVRIATSRYGEPLSVPTLGDLTARITDTGGMTVVFGSPGRGLPDMLGMPPEDVADVEPSVGPGFDLWLNTIPRQGSEVVRTEEAMFASLASLTLTE